jgi:carotenoid phi-ring synthase / carotenoid chi-ring synthase
MRRIYPELEPATIFADEWLVNDDCPLWSTDPWEQRPTVRTPHSRIVLAPVFHDGFRSVVVDLGICGAG